jgi:hypothetical protein
VLRSDDNEKEVVEESDLDASDFAYSAQPIVKRYAGEGRCAGLSKIALECMLVEAENASPVVNCDNTDVVLGHRTPVPPAFMADYVEPNNEALLHDSFRRAWWDSEIPRPQSRGADTSLPKF